MADHALTTRPNFLKNNPRAFLRGNVRSIDRIRSQLEKTIEQAIACLNLLDGDENIEETGDEHDVGMPEGWRKSSHQGETILEDDEDGHDDEPSLGGMARSYNWVVENDLEADGADDEPALGWTGNIDQTIAAIIHSGFHGTDEDEPELGWCGNGIGWRTGEPLEEGEEEREADPAEAGIADADAMHSMWAEPAMKQKSVITDKMVGDLRGISAKMRAAESELVLVSEPGSLFMRVKVQS